MLSFGGRKAIEESKEAKAAKEGKEASEAGA